MSLCLGLVILYFAINPVLNPVLPSRKQNTFTPTVSPAPSLSPAVDKKEFITPLSSSSATVGTFGEGQLCGGIGNIQCPPELYCKKDASDREASGFCTKL